MDFSFLQDPNILQGMGNAGAALSNGASFGDAFNPAGLIQQIQKQKAAKGLLDILAGSAIGADTGGAISALDPNGMSTGTPALDQITPTPIGQPGPDSVTRNTTADGTTTTIKEPSAKNLSTYGTSVPPEMVRAPQPVQSGGSPFWKALLGM